MKVWLDDVRPAPEGWKWVKSPAEAINLLITNQVTEISLDHDLALFRGDGSEATGYDVLLWMEYELARDGTTIRLPPEIHVHSANPVAQRKMAQAIASIRRLTNPRA